jgi:excisionase family DNA binding protein
MGKRIEQPIERKSYRVPEVARATGVSVAQVYKMVQDGELRSVKVGKMVLVPAAAVDELLAGSR